MIRQLLGFLADLTLGTVCLVCGDRCRRDCQDLHAEIYHPGEVPR